MRLDLMLAERWIAPDARVLDLGCGEGDLLAHLGQRQGVRGYGVEIDPERIRRCVARGVNVIEHDLDAGLALFGDDRFDTVVMTMALQVVAAPDRLLLDMLRVGREAIITFPNFAYWKTRLYLALRGRMPMSEALPYHWYDTPNIHLCTFADFDALCAEHHLRILDRHAVNGEQASGPLMQAWPNVFGEVAIYRVARHA